MVPGSGILSPQKNSLAWKYNLYAATLLSDKIQLNNLQVSEIVRENFSFTVDEVFVQ